MTSPLLEVSVTAGYGSTTTLENVCFTLDAGERVGVVGTSGAGKSTLVQALLCMLPWRKGWARGHIRFNGQDLLRCSERELRKLRGKHIGLVPQSPATALNPALTLQAHFDELWRAHAKRGEEQAKRMRQLLARVELPADTEFLNRRPGQVSIGQAQRVMIALALLHDPLLLIADEPTSALDVCIHREIVQLLQDVSHEQGTTLLYVSHDLVSVLRLCERMLVMSHGVLVESLDFTQDQLQTHHQATCDLLQTLPASLSALRQTGASRFARPRSATGANTCRAASFSL